MNFKMITTKQLLDLLEAESKISKLAWPNNKNEQSDLAVKLFYLARPLIEELIESREVLNGECYCIDDSDHGGLVQCAPCAHLEKFMKGNENE